MPQNSLEESVEKIKEFQKKLEEAAANTKDVKEGKATKEEEQQEPGYILFQGITETSIKILQMPIVAETLNGLADKLGDNTAKKLTEMLAIIMTNSAYCAINFYDELLKQELQKQFDNVGQYMSRISGDVHAHNSVLEIHQKRLDAIDKAKTQEAIKNAAK